MATRDTDDDEFARAMATLGVKAGARSARSIHEDARHPAAPEVQSDIDFDALMRDAGRGALVVTDDAVPSAPTAPAPKAEESRPARAAPSADEIALFERAMAGLVAPPPESSSAARPRAVAQPKRSIDYARLLKQGRLEFDATCDLHGATREDARRRLTAFLSDAKRADWRVLHVIVGKGLHSTGEPVLRGAVKSWLETVFRDDYATCLEPPPAAGGSGAFVLIRRP